MSSTDGLALMTHHHRYLEELFDEVLEAEDAEQRGWAVQKAADRLTGLMDAEERLLYVQFPADDPLRRQAERQHAHLRELCNELVALAPVDDGVEPGARALWQAVLEHHRWEEQEAFAQAARELPMLQRQALAGALAVSLVQLHAAGAARRAALLRNRPIYADVPSGAEISRSA